MADFDFNGGKQSGQPRLEKFESGLAKLFGAREALLVNSGTSANLVAVSALTSPRMGKLQLKPGDEVITLAAGSPSLAAAIVQNQLVPVFDYRVRFRPGRGQSHWPICTATRLTWMR